MGLRIVFMGTPVFSVPVLQALLGSEHEVIAVYSQPPRKSGRGMKATKSPVHKVAEENDIEIRTPISFKETKIIDDFKELGADLAVVVAYGLILPKSILTSPKYGCFNIHASLLPRWRGAAPIQRAIMSGDHKTGVMIMRMDEGLDTGDISTTAVITIAEDMTAGELHDKLSIEASNLIISSLSELMEGTLSFYPQKNSNISYAKKIEKKEARIDWSDSVISIYNKIRGLSPFPGAWFEIIQNGEHCRVKILQCEKVLENEVSNIIENKVKPGQIIDSKNLIIACDSGAIRPIILQRQGKAAMQIGDFLKGVKIEGDIVF